jgi:GTPase-associated protein 1
LNDTLRLDQAVFGYREGHRLLQASRRFDSITERTLVALSDMSGPRMLEGFEEYLSGFPVRDDDSYAIAKTWYAPEMDRPGCVWTHVLLIKTEDLSKVPEARSITPYFRRPDSSLASAYQQPLFLSLYPDPSATSSDSHEIQELLTALYDREATVVIPSANSLNYEHLVLAIWSQQWPGLRATFRFCTGSLMPRSLNNESFDLQIAPTRLAREFKRDAKATILFQPHDTAQSSASPPPWLAHAMNDLSGHERSFRDFLWRYAEPCANSRQLFRDLGRTYSRLFGGIGDAKLAEFVEELSSIFPSAQQGKKLKRDLFGNAPSSDTSFPLVDFTEDETLRELAQTPFADSFDPVDLRLRERAFWLWQRERQSAEALLYAISAHSTQNLGEQITIGLAEALTGTDLCELAQTHPNLAIGMVARNLQLASQEEVWRCPIPRQWQFDLLDLLKSSPNGKQDMSRWLPTAIKAAPAHLIQPIVERFRYDAIAACLDWYDNQETRNYDLSAAWREALSNFSDDLITWADPLNRPHSLETLALLASILDPRLSRVIELGPQPWLPLAAEPRNSLSKDDSAEVPAFLLAIGFRQSDSTAAALLAAAFEPVHESAGRGTLGYRSWQFLKDELPSISWSRSWDKCERLRRGLLRHFIRTKWPIADFLRCLSNGQTFRAILYSTYDVDGGQHYVESIAHQVIMMSMPVTQEQLDIFNQSFKFNRRGELKLHLP